MLEGFVSGDELAAAQEGLWAEYPRPDVYFADPAAYPEYATGQFAGLREYPFSTWELNRVAHHPDLVDLAERFCGASDLELYKVQLWAKYSGAIDYEQVHHRDFSNHSLVVPRRDLRWRQLTTFVLLSDVGEEDGPTKVVPLSASADVPLWPAHQPAGAFADVEVSVTGPAGTLFAYRTDVLHRASRITGGGRSRFVLLADFQARGPTWNGKTSWPDRAPRPQLLEVLERATVRERDLFGFPPPASEYWTAETIDDVQRRYPAMDMTPYRDALGE